VDVYGSGHDSFVSNRRLGWDNVYSLAGHGIGVWRCIVRVGRLEL